jgi:hypothetical protein
MLEYLFMCHVVIARILGYPILGDSYYLSFQVLVGLSD